MNRLRVAAFCAVVLLVPAAGIRAQDRSKAALVVAINNLNEVFNDVSAVAQWAGAADQIGFPLMLVRPAVSKVDQTKPLGGFVSLDQGEPKLLVFLPVEDLKGLFAQQKELIGSPKELGGGKYEFRANEQSIYVKEGKGWAYLSNDSGSLANTPDNPAETLAALTRQYDVAVQLNVQNIPAELRNVARTQIKSLLAIAPLGAGDAALQEQMRANVEKQLDTMFDDVDSVTVGLAIDAKAQNIAMEFGMTARDGSALAKQMAQGKDAKSEFSGLATDAAAISMHLITTLAADDIEQALGNFKALREQAMQEIDNGGRIPDQAARDTIKGALTSIMDAVEATIKGGKLDLGSSIVLEDDEFQMVIGGLLVDGTKLENGIKKLVELTKNAPGAPQIQLNAGTHKGVNFHVIDVPLDGVSNDVQDIFGESVEITLGIGANRMFLAVGDDGIGLIKASMQNAESGKGKSALPMVVQVAMTPIMKFAAAISEDPNMERVAKSLAQSDGKDHIRVTSRTIPRGSVGRLEVETGVLKAIGAAAAAGGGGGGGGGARNRAGGF